MKILMIFHAAPYPPELGPARRNYHLLTELLKRHDVTVLSFGTAEQERAFRLHFGNECGQVHFVANRRPAALSILTRLLLTISGGSALRLSHTRRLQGCLDLLAATDRFDLVFLSMPFLARYRLPIHTPSVTDAHNVEWVVMQRCFRETRSWWRKAYYFLQTRHTRREEVEAAARVNAVLTTSHSDLETFRSSLPLQRHHVVPNGVDFSAYPAQLPAPEPLTLLFTGLMSYYPNEHGIEWFLDEIFPRIRAVVPETRLTIAGARPSRRLKARASEHVRVTGYVPRIADYMARAEVVVAPLRIGGGTRVKILEAMAMRRPVVATALACEGLAVAPDDSVLIADTPKAFADSVIRLLRDRSLCERIAIRGYALVTERYQWNAIGSELDEVLQSVVNGHRGMDRAS